MAGRKVVDEILKKANVELNTEHIALLGDAIHRVGLLKNPKIAAKIANSINLTIDLLLKKNEGLQAFETELREAFLNMASTENAKEILRNEFNTKGTNFTDPELDIVVQEFEKMSKDLSIIGTMGDKTAKEFTQKVKNLTESYYHAPAKEKRETLLKNLESLQEWSKEKEQTSKGSAFSKMGKVISSYVKAVRAHLNGDKEAYEKNMKNAHMAIAVLNVNAATLGKISSKTTESVKLINTPQGEKNQSNKSAVDTVQEKRNNSNQGTIISR